MAQNQIGINSEAKNNLLNIKNLTLPLDPKSKGQLFTILGQFMETPVSIMTTISDLLETPLDDWKKKGLLEVMEEVSSHSLEVVNNVLDYETLGTSRCQVSPKKFQLDFHLYYWMLELKRTAHKKGLDFHVHVPPSFPFLVTADPKLIEKIIFNLVSNAVKFTQKGEVSIGLEIKTAGPENLLECCIRDTGKGIGKNRLQWVFEPFAQEDHNPLEYKGLGLGLTVTQSLVKLLNGRLEVKSTPGLGTEFRILLPMDRVEQRSS